MKHRLNDLPNLLRRSVKSAVDLGRCKFLGATIKSMEDKSSASSPVPTDDQERYDRVLERAKEVFTDAGKAQEWLNTPNLVLGDKPVSLLVSDAGERSVLAVLSSIEYGAPV